MRFGFVHRVMTNALAALGVIALVASGELGRWINVAIVVGLAAALAVPEAWHGKVWLNRLAGIGPVGLLAVQITRWFAGRPMLELAVEFAAALQVVRLATRRGAAHDQQVIVLALLHLIAGTVLGGGIGYGLCFVGFLIVAPGALVLSHLRREVEGNYRQGARDRTGLPVDVPRILRSRRVVGRTFLAMTCLLALPILVFTTVLFVVFPRVGLSLLLVNRSHSGRMVGFSDHVDLGGVGVLRDDPQIALRVEVADVGEPPPERLTMYLRGTALDAYDGRAWSRTSVQRTPIAGPRQTIFLDRSTDVATERVLLIDLESFDPPVLFVPPNAVSLQVMPRSDTAFLTTTRLLVERGGEGEFRYRLNDDRGVRYEVHVARTALVHPGALAPEEIARYLALPPMAPRIAELARAWTTSAPTPMEKARAIEAHLRTEYRYDLSSPSGGTDAPLDHFLFDSKRGHCEFYSTAMAVLLRHVGVPTRNVTGFIGGTFNRFSRNYTVRQGDAHSWVEAYVDGIGWTRFDPTPPSDAAPKSEISGMLALFRDVLEASSQRWDRHVVGYDINQQFSVYDRMRHSFQRATRGASQGSLPSIGAVAGSLGLLVALGAAWVIRRRRVKVASPKRAPGDARARAATLAASLYEMLDAALVAQGLTRAQGTPPLAHALATDVRAHPMASEILALTETYIATRFGGQTLDDDAKRDFEQRVRLVKTFRPKKALGARSRVGRGSLRAPRDSALSIHHISRKSRQM